MTTLEPLSGLDVALAPDAVRGLGIEAFDALRAEAEPWLAQALETPPEFDLYGGPRSCIVFGEPGAGKSALLAAMALRSANGADVHRCLVVSWRLHVAADEREFGDDLAARLLIQAFDACALAVIDHLMHHQAYFAEARPWAQRILHWFVHRYLRGDREQRTGPFERAAGEEGIALRNRLLVCPERSPVEDDSELEMVMAQLVSALPEVGLQGVWVLVDRVEAADEAGVARLAAGLRAFFSNLKFFEQEGFAFKFLLPLHLRPKLAGARGIETQRLRVHYLTWDSVRLAAIVVKRMGLAVGKALQNMDEICADPQLPEWLERCGGMTPRGWLEQFRPLAAAYLDRRRSGQHEPISAEEWRAIRKRHPPSLYFDAIRETVRVGERVVELPDEQRKLFRYLYERRGQVCTRSELYYRAYLGLSSERNIGDDDYAGPATYRTLIETAIWRLRKSLEPAEDTIFIRTVKGQGYRLEWLGV